MSKKGEIIPFLKEKVACPVCESSDVETKQVKDSFEYGVGNSKVFLSAVIPAHKCLECAFEFTGVKADDLRHEAVCRHLGLLPPREVRDVRKGLSRAEFSRRTGIGEASLGRWERGFLLQNAAMDNFLYLLSLSGNLEALRRRSCASKRVESESVFQCIELTDVLRERQANFSL